MDDTKELVRDKANAIEQLIKDIQKCIEKGDDYRPLSTQLDQNLTEMKTALASLQDAAKSRLAKSLADQYQETYNTLKRDAATIVKLAEETAWKNQLLGSGQSTVDESFSDLLLKEERGLDNSLKTTSSILDTASEVRHSLSHQKRSLEGVGEKVVRFAETLPGVNILLRKVSRRKRLNAIVMSLAVAVCVCMIMYLTLS